MQHSVAPAPSFIPPVGLLYRKCACGGTPGSSGECDACRKEKRHHVANYQSTLNPERPVVSPALRETLPTSGQPLDAETPTVREPRFGHDFGQMRVQADASSSEVDEREVDGSSSETEPESGSGIQAGELKPQSPENLTTVVKQHQGSFSAVLRRAAKPQPSSLGAPVSAEADREPREGETLRLPEIVISAPALLDQRDAIASTFAYTSTVKKAGATPPASDFGITRPVFKMKISGTQDSSGFTLKCDVDGEITFQLASLGRTDIGSDSDPDITQANYAQVVSDLTPNTSDLNGRPPRTKFWAEDLTERHERFHATEDVSFGGAGVLLAEKWLNKQTAADQTEAVARANQALNIVKSKVDTEMAPPESEKRAYGDGASPYRSRATAIKTKGDAGKYAAAPTPGGGAGKK